ncbi:serine/threonine-protein phosphatase 7 long form homolog [Mercurialis annua]|uniref:serine/threonine-protein phosphatase 7 long form homolog n=1 Tax=Mercurialis annua TaxID=3986 RepID=UPI0024ACFF10|nr:serine/threonine-protein phosphatase 7 long form homolog [Mercurialis annua]
MAAPGGHYQPEYFQPGPLNDELLTQQYNHISSYTWDHPEDVSVLGSRTSHGLPSFGSIDSRIQEGVRRTGLSGFIRMRQYRLDMSIITALVERWRPETHTFMFPDGECTITLQDIAILTGLPIDGTAVTGDRVDDWQDRGVALLGRPLELSQSEGTSWVGSRWLYSEFREFTSLPAYATPEHVEWAVRAYLWAALQTLCFPDLNSGHLGLRILPLLANLHDLRTISWGSAVLAHLYHEMCITTRMHKRRRNIGGPLWIVQLWAFERLRPLRPQLLTPIIAEDLPLGDRWGGRRDRRAVPRHSIHAVRLILDGLRYEDIHWQPYSDDILSSIPREYLDGAHLWRARVPLIYYNIVEWHQPDRVLQQFGLVQPIPLPPLQTEELHNVRYRGSSSFAYEMDYWVQLWNNRNAFVVQGRQLQHPPHYHSQYMDWYRRRCRRWITLQGAEAGTSRDLQERTHVTGEASSSAARRIRFGARSSQLATMEDRRDVTLPPPEPADQPYQLPPLPPCQVDLSSIRGRRRQPRRMPPQPRPEHVYPIPEPLFFHTEVAGTSDIPQPDYWERQHYGSTSGATPQASYPQFQVPPASMPYVDSFFGDTTFTTTQDRPGPSESQVPPAPMSYSDSSFRHTTFANTRDPFAPSDSQVRQPPIPSFHSYLGEMGYTPLGTPAQPESDQSWPAPPTHSDVPWRTSTESDFIEQLFYYPAAPTA